MKKLRFDEKCLKIMAFTAALLLVFGMMMGGSAALADDANKGVSYKETDGFVAYESLYLTIKNPTGGSVYIRMRDITTDSVNGPLKIGSGDSGAEYVGRGTQVSYAINVSKFSPGRTYRFALRFDGYSKTEWLERVITVQPTISYRVRTVEDGWRGEASNNGIAGASGHTITDIMVKVNVGSVKYQVHVKGGSWLPYVTGYSTSDYNNGYAGNGKPIDAIRVVYTAPGNTAMYAAYQVKNKANSNFYGVQKNDTSNGTDNYAGAMNVSLDQIRIRIGK